MNVRQAKQLLRGYRPSGADDEERDIRTALKIAAQTPAFEAEFHNQLAFDRGLSEVLNNDLPEELSISLESLAKQIESRPSRHFIFRDPAMWTVALSFLVLVGLMVWIFMGKMNSFSGMQEAIEMVQQGDNARVDQFQAVETSAGRLNDWFVMQEFDGFTVPRGMESAPVIGVRIFKYDGIPVAVAAVTEPQSLCYVFEAAPFGISLAKDDWKIVEYGRNKRGLGITQIGNMAFVIALREGGKADLKKVLSALNR